MLSYSYEIFVCLMPLVSDSSLEDYSVSFSL